MSTQRKINTVGEEYIDNKAYISEVGRMVV